ncbi:D-tagatose-bisphosphate aldolase, class II, non-catalytic subunit [Acidipila sp. EB88]|uniref:D-tagatose-bisphosphate aldolase, class II, non-catalytic subunit n=1 Tax=Acidipila sp. EB88 TaxID=2305226 RepID=UPI000F5E2F6F|nr:D-tagatose-bisphosphate aldolase, class II, non-catalytic subunit [Acidipila sp. EB88]RRA49831.1 D-tagatose-bisphosphate aldolase, class II, non-catalytic subunit [Acidipila sp. EB88]
MAHLEHPLQQLLSLRRQGIASGIYSVCSAHPWVIRAAAEQAASDGCLLLIEATSNQVNQFGGYTGMQPAAFCDFVFAQVRAAGLPKERLILGGDHLGPNPWRAQPAAEAMQQASIMVSEYVSAGFTKIHLDASMPCADDRQQPSDALVAERTVILCKAAEAAAAPGTRPVYVVGTEVPTPGGATHSLEGLQVTSENAVAETLRVYREAFAAAGLEDAWSRVIALVVQPGVEFDHDSVVHYDRAKATPLTRWLARQQEAIVFEAHSTDYQRPAAYKALVEDGFAILKVGPALTFAMREALYALEDMEKQLLPVAQQSHLSDTVEETMLREPADWQAHYHGSLAEQRLLRQYSYSDRVRYYWPRPAIAHAVQTLVANLESTALPESMLSRYLPAQYVRLRARQIAGDPVSLVVDRIKDVLRVYAAATPAV